MNPAILITTHPNTNEKNDILINFGNFLQNYHIPSFVFSNYPTTINSQKLFTGSFFSNYNPDGPSQGLIWKQFNNFKHHKLIPNWCYSFMHLILSGAKILKSLGYTHFIFLIYDSELNHEKIKNFIEYSIKKLSEKKGIFVEYEAGWENSLSTTQCACNIDFFLNLFEPTLPDYFAKKYSLLAEHYWYEVIYSDIKDIEILGRDSIIKTIYNSGDCSKVNNIPYFLGYLDFQDKFLLKLNTSLNNFKMYNEKIEINKQEFIEEDNYVSIYFTGNPFSKFYLQFPNCDEKYFLFEDIPHFRSHNFYRKQ